jgi:hypothetical protein
MLKAILRAMSSSESSETPFPVVLILPVWEDTPWSFASIRGHRNVSTLTHIPTGHMRLEPAHRQSDDMTAILAPAM